MAQKDAAKIYYFRNDQGVIMQVGENEAKRLLSLGYKQVTDKTIIGKFKKLKVQAPGETLLEPVKEAELQELEVLESEKEPTKEPAQ